MNKRRAVFRLLGLLFSVLPPLICTVLYFPIWRERSAEVMLSGISLILLALSVLPAYRLFVKYMRSPSAYMIWFIIFVLFLLLSKIADDMTVISFVGFISNLMGAVFFKLSKRKVSINEGEL